MIKRYGEWIVSHSILVVLLSVAVVMGLGYGGSKLSFRTDYEVFFSDSNPQLVAFKKLQDTYTKNENVMIMLEPKSGNVFTPEVLSAVVELTDRAWQTPFSSRVDSISNYQHTYSEEDDLMVADLIEEPESLNTGDIESLKATALDQPALVNRLVSPDGSVTGVNITINLPPELSAEDLLLPKAERDLIDPTVANPVVVNFVDEMVKEMEASYPDITFYQTGVILMNGAFSEASIADMQKLIPLAFLVIIVGILFLIRSPISMLCTILLVFLSIIAAMGAAGWAGIRLTPPSASAPTLILTLAVADCVHFLVSLYHGARRGMAKKEAIVESLRINFMPIFLTSVTTAIGFLSMNFSDAPPFRDLGNITAMGVIFAFLLSVTFLPAFSSLMPIKTSNIDAKKSTLMDRLSDFVIHFQKPLLWGMAAVMLALIALVPRNELNDVFVNYFDESVPFRVETDHVADKLTGLYFVDFSIDSKEEGGISDPAFLQQIEQFERFLEDQPEVDHVMAFTETMRRLNKSMHSDDESYYLLPEERELSAQLQLMYEMSLPFGLDLNNQINFDKSATRMTATMKTISTQEMLAFETRAYEWMEQNTPKLATLGSGPTMMFSHIGMRNIKSMLGGTTIALILISGILILALRSFKFGMVSLIPNIAPALMGFGVWGLMVGEVGLAVSVVIAMTLGIVVDDTIHFLSKYLRARREQNLSPEQAVRYAFNTVGVALTVTTIVLVGGFLVLSTSNFLVNSQMGLLTAITIAIALIVDFLFLPPLLMKIDGDNKSETDAIPAPA
ncbi:MAG: MMPL family transporter [Granulosicoccus sp.]|nr:MMPL family transporter [Granulosicoccus sp.]